MVSERASEVSRFIAMDVLATATCRDDVVHLELGEPDFEPPAAAVEAAVESLQSGDNRYTATRGKPALRRAIADRYDRRYGVDVDPDRIVVTPGSSPGLFLALAAAVDPGDPVVLPDPHYACYPNFARLVGAESRTVPLSPDDGFQPRVADVEAALGRGGALLVNSPANPTGAVIDGSTLSGLVAAAERAHATVIADEIYHGLAYDAPARSVLEYTDDAFVLDGCSKRYGMTGWRLGWIVAPPEAVDALVALAQNVLLCAPSFVQDGAVAAIETPRDRLASIRERYREHRDLLLDALTDWGLHPGYTPDGAFYVLADVSDRPGDSLAVAERWLEEAGVAVTPGVDFGDGAGEYVRLSVATDRAAIETAIDRIDAFLTDRNGS